jgi:hypothetical protein
MLSGKDALRESQKSKSAPRSPKSQVFPRCSGIDLGKGRFTSDHDACNRGKAERGSGGSATGGGGGGGIQPAHCCRWGGSQDGRL